MEWRSSPWQQGHNPRPRSALISPHRSGSRTPTSGLTSTMPQPSASPTEVCQWARWWFRRARPASSPPRRSMWPRLWAPMPSRATRASPASWAPGFWRWQARGGWTGRWSWCSSSKRRSPPTWTASWPLTWLRRRCSPWTANDQQTFSGSSLPWCCKKLLVLSRHLILFLLWLVEVWIILFPLLLLSGVRYYYLEIVSVIDTLENNIIFW